jgi:para-nitrobenzyl esterase
MSSIFVRTEGGLIRGLALKDPAPRVSFRAVPYAQPPVGALRWRPPQPKTPWQGVLDCTQYPCAAWGPGTGGEPYLSDFHYQGLEPMSEDCLYLNIDTAFVPGENRPVFVWFHGGGLLSGSAYEPEFDPAQMVRRGVVVVSVGQRLGLFGYLALPQLAQQDGRSGNYGFMDQLLAMRWVRANIAAFGGDPDNVTIGGQSGGSQKCCLLAASPQGRGLFGRMILQSGLKYRQRFLPLEEGYEKGRAFLRAMDLDENLSAAALREIPAAFFFGRPAEIPGICPGVRRFRPAAAAL